MLSSFFFSGAGQLKNGNKFKALFLLPVSLIFYFFSFFGLAGGGDPDTLGFNIGRSEAALFCALSAAWIYGVIDAYATASRASGMKKSAIALVLAAGCFIWAHGVGSSLARSFNHKIETMTRGRLAVVRSQLSIYYGDKNGQYPSALSALTLNGKYLNSIPFGGEPPYHSNSRQFKMGLHPDDSGGWMYDNVPSDVNYGTVWINCTHTDSRGTAWNSY